jgi:ClpP class serine protease
MKNTICLILILSVIHSVHGKEKKPNKTNKMQKPSIHMEIQNDTSLRLIGSINRQNIDAVLEKIKNSPNINKLIITSGGGEVSSNIKVAYLLKERAMAIEVVDYCLSSCFNYLFLAASSRTIRPHSVLGFHGIATTSFPFVARVIKSFRTVMKQEKKFYNSIGMEIKTWKKFHKKVNKLTKNTETDMFAVGQKFFDKNQININSPWFPQSQNELNKLLEEINKRVVERRKKPHKTWLMMGDFS